MGPLSHLANEGGIRDERSPQTMETNPSTANEGRYAPGRSTLLPALALSLVNCSLR